MNLSHRFLTKHKYRRSMPNGTSCMSMSVAAMNSTLPETTS
jgi:hypothetical protein